LPGVTCLVGGNPPRMKTQAKLSEDEVIRRNAEAQELLAELVLESQGLMREARVILQALETQMRDLMSVR
jgi:hypothetical protein